MQKLFHNTYTRTMALALFLGYAQQGSNADQVFLDARNKRMLAEPPATGDAPAAGGASADAAKSNDAPTVPAAAKS